MHIYHSHVLQCDFMSLNIFLILEMSGSYVHHKSCCFWSCVNANTHLLNISNVIFVIN